MTATVCILVLVLSSACATNFGHSMKSLFALDPTFTNLNHGSFGSVPKSVTQAQRGLIDEQEAFPDKYVTHMSFRSRSLFCNVSHIGGGFEYVNADPDDVVFVENASSGVNSVLRTFPFEEGDVLLHLSCAYPMVIYTSDYVASRFGVNVVTVNISFPVAGPEDFLGPVEEALRSLPGRFRLAVFSHVSSVPSVVLPVKELTDLVHRHGAQVLIDGAHAVGQVPIDIKDMNPDFYVSNAHKWLFAPKGSAFLYVRRNDQREIVPTVISSTGKRDFIGEFEYTGTRDYTPYCAVNAALDFRAQLGDAAITKYNHDLAAWAGEYLAALWGTETIAPANMTGSITNVRLPISDPALATSLSDRLFQDYDTYIVVYALNGQYWTRLSAQIYVERSDFARLGEIVKQIAAIKTFDGRVASAPYLQPLNL